MYHKVDIDLKNIKAVSDRVLDAFEAKKPFSLIRLGDGESVVLGYPELVTPTRYMRWMTNFFGTQNVNISAYSAIKEWLIEAIKSSDVVGISSQACDDIALARQEMQRLGSKGENLSHQEKVDIAALEWGVLFYLTSHLFHENQLLTTTSVHKDLESTGLIRVIISGSNCINIITGNNLAPLFLNAFPEKNVHLHMVPTEYKFEKDRSSWEKSEPHFPNVFENIMMKIKRGNFPGLSLVGAGPCGKAYCGAIRSAGGFAIDVGSIMDLWAGRNTRSFITSMQIVTFQQSSIL